MADEAIDSDTIHKVLTSYMERFSAEDKDGWLDLFAEDAWIEDPVGTPRRHGRDEIGVFWDEVHTVPDSIELRPLGIQTVVGNEGIFAMQARASLGGQIFGVDIIDLMSFNAAGKIATMRAFFDQSTMRPVE
ncbi:MAG TPA: nuclear transport factor 2 family protein [Acidimicrobiales bacterium]|jgi:steroid delta-isomerase